MGLGGGTAGASVAAQMECRAPEGDFAGQRSHQDRARELELECQQATEDTRKFQTDVKKYQNILSLVKTDIYLTTTLRTEHCYIVGQIKGSRMIGQVKEQAPIKIMTYKELGPGCQG